MSPACNRAGLFESACHRLRDIKGGFVSRLGSCKLPVFHANRRWFRWLADRAGEYDSVAYTGDFLGLYGAETLGRKIDSKVGSPNTRAAFVPNACVPKDCKMSGMPVSGARICGASLTN